MAERWFDNGAASEVLGYVPSTTLEKGLEEALADWNGVKARSE
jgi:nucleoside-diphosphate-sugar epimerase